MEITPEIFQNRLRKMLECERVCTKCPLTIGFAAGEVLDIAHQRQNGSNCTMCRSFVGIPILTTGLCPCNFLGHPDEAIAAAHHALALWDAGEHPMQEEGE